MGEFFELGTRVPMEEGVSLSDYKKFEMKERFRDKNGLEVECIADTISYFLCHLCWSASYPGLADYRQSETVGTHKRVVGSG